MYMHACILCVCVCVHPCKVNVPVFSVSAKMREAEGYQYTTKEGADLERALVELRVNKPVVTMKVRAVLSLSLVLPEISFVPLAVCVNQFNLIPELLSVL